MKAVIQRNKKASLYIAGKEKAAIDGGLVVLLGIREDDTQEDAIALAKKIAGLRIFEDENQKMNNNIFSDSGEILIVSNFTLYGDCSRGFRPSFIQAMMPQRAEELYNFFIEECKKYEYKKIATGEFGADMQLSLTNDGPVTIIIESNDLKRK